MHTFLLITDK